MIQVAAYCRVSTDKEDQQNSFESQMRFFREYTDRRPDWKLYEVYADEGITGTSTKKRKHFNRMIHDARMGKFQLILTKEVSRFSRNIMDTIGFTRELKSLGIGVLFMNDGIHTLDPDAELRLSIMGSIAQEESRKTSERVRWGQAQQMKHGVVFGRSMLGYNVENGKMTVNPAGAETVRLIFHKYGVEHKGTGVIARELREAGIPTNTGNTKWRGSSVLKILKNEKYVGDLVQKKTITPDYLTHAKKYNHGEEELVIIKNHHEPIIERELWNTVQSLIQKANRSGDRGVGHSNRYVFSGKIKCGQCGESFVSRKKQLKNGAFYRRWCCSTVTREGIRHLDPLGKSIGCDVGKQLREELAMEILKQTIASLQMDTKSIISNVTSIAFEAIQAGEPENPDIPEKLEQAIQTIHKKKEAALDAFFSKDITKEEMRMMEQRYDSEIAAICQRLRTARTKPNQTDEGDALREDLRRHVTAIVRGKTDSEVFYKKTLSRMTVYQDCRVEVKLNLLPTKWCFVLEKNRDILRKTQTDTVKNEASDRVHSDASVPMSVSSPFSSSKGME